ncbi:hypothetical protein U2T19_004016 [Salmonella enterica]|nr:hypothetical protein [Salmonella enterica]EGI1954790.1 hypothetical protein [Salmonella enterica]EMA3597725.1 hypothetical protein [Salmonella enterica]
MLTQQIIREEIEELKKIIYNDELEIPSFWMCAKPGLLIWLWLFICPLFAFNLSGSMLSDTLISVGFSSFLGFILFFWAINASGLALSIPKGFRKRSKVILMLNKKIKCYVAGYMVIILILSFLSSSSGMGPLSYGFPLILITIFFVVIFSADISRYKLSALSELIKSVAEKTRLNASQQGDLMLIRTRLPAEFI